MTTLEELLPALTAPFAADQIELKPGALTHDRSRALALAYADTRVYQDRLDQVVGPAHWSVHLELTPVGVVCALTICGVTKADVGDFPLEDEQRPLENRATTATAQAFKRACAAFGLGRYLYNLPRTWADYDPEERAFVDAPHIIRSLYQAAGLADGLPKPADADPPSASRRTPDPVRLARARSALAEAEQRSDGASAPAPATDAQLGLIARLLITLQRQAADAADAADAIDAIGEEFQLTNLSDCTSKAKLRVLALSKPSASDIIQRLQALSAPAAA
jgi:hypothetical protein